MKKSLSVLILETIKNFSDDSASAIPAISAPASIVSPARSNHAATNNARPMEKSNKYSSEVENFWSKKRNP
jgi:hypothetical protein